MKSILVIDDDTAVRQLLADVLHDAGYAVDTAEDGVDGLEKLRAKSYDLMLLDIWMPRMNGLDLLAQLQAEPSRPKVMVMTADNTPETVLTTIRAQAYQFVAKPFSPQELKEMVTKAFTAPSETIPIEVISARPDWVELLVPCELEVVDRIQNFLMHLKADVPSEIRESVGRAFHELLLNAIEWGGQLDPKRKVRIAFLRARRMLLYRIADPGRGFKQEALAHAALNNPPNEPFEHARVREEMGLRAGGFGIMLVRTMVDELIYNDARNEVVFVKYLD